MLPVLAARHPVDNASAPGCVAGELLTVTAACAHDPAATATCATCRSFTGLRTRRRTSTAQVIAQHLTPAEYVEVHHASLLRAGLSDTATVRALAGESARDTARIAAAFPVGTLLRRIGDHIEQHPLRSPHRDHGPSTPDDPPRDPAVSLGTGRGVLSGLSEVAP